MGLSLSLDDGPFMLSDDDDDINQCKSVQRYDPLRQRLLGTVDVCEEN